MSVVDIRKQVQDRVANEAASMPPASREVTPDLIQKCLLLNELGDGTLFAMLCQDRFVYCKNRGVWLEWAGHHWRIDIMDKVLAAVDEVAAVYAAAHEVAGPKISDLMAESDDQGEIQKLFRRRGQLLRRAKELRGEKRRNACLKFAHTSNSPLAVQQSFFDQKPMLFACANGVIDLETGKLKPGRPGDYLSMASPVSFLDINTAAPLWERTLDEIFAGNREVIAYLQRLLGYSITGLTTEKIFPILYGRTGWNGRTLIVEAVSRVMGNMAGPIPAEMLLAQKYGRNASGPSPDIMALRGLRIAFAAEVDEWRRFSSSRIKWLTGSDQLVGRNPHDRFQTCFDPTHKLFLMTNFLPHASSSDKAFWERLHVIPFAISFVNRDPREAHERRAVLDLDIRLAKERAGILAWLVRGCLEWQRQGLKPPKGVIEEGKKYQRNEDLLADFDDECCEKIPTAEWGASHAYNSFVDWYHKNIGRDAPSATWFGQRFSEKFARRKTRGLHVYVGVALKKGYLDG